MFLIPRLDYATRQVFERDFQGDLFYSTLEGFLFLLNYYLQKGTVASQQEGPGSARWPFCVHVLLVSVWVLSGYWGL